MPGEWYEDSYYDPGGGFNQVQIAPDTYMQGQSSSGFYGGDLSDSEWMDAINAGGGFASPTYTGSGSTTPMGGTSIPMGGYQGGFGVPTSGSLDWNATYGPGTSWNQGGGSSIPPQPSRSQGVQGPMVPAPQLFGPDQGVYNQWMNFLNNPNDFSNLKAYQWLVDQGNQAFSRQAGAGGKRFSGNTLAAAADFSQNNAMKFMTQMLQALQQGYQGPAQLQVGKYGASHGGSTSSIGAFPGAYPMPSYSDTSYSGGGYAGDLYSQPSIPTGPSLAQYYGGGTSGTVTPPGYGGQSYSSANGPDAEPWDGKLDEYYGIDPEYFT